ncbi:MAG TPA: VOC family protein [Chloroflexota bacterium]|nr:VOC family protein [Chloroflexota bacterium]
MAPAGTVQCVQHVSVPRPRGSHDMARRFYGELLGLEEIPAPDTIAHLDLIWYRVGDSELHLFASDRLADGLAAHFCLQVDDLPAVRERLSRGGVEIVDDLPIPNRPRFFCRDPFGNRIEFTSIQGSYR